MGAWSHATSSAAWIRAVVDHLVARAGAGGRYVDVAQLERDLALLLRLPPYQFRLVEEGQRYLDPPQVASLAPSLGVSADRLWLDYARSCALDLMSRGRRAGEQRRTGNAPGTPLPPTGDGATSETSDSDR